MFYAKHSILQSGNEEQTQFRLALTAGVEQVIKNGLTLLGIEAPERM
ncbi:MAG: DALR anticodon-binding domain-containing protein [Candidatus Gribaldobacteria bacterium]|nr:DALR anticodon-binding domain-containing protein [Candidatus Gribaldobacteria bacterium]